MTRAVLDPNVLVAAALAPHGPPADCLRAHAEGRFELVVSEKLLAELGGVLAREKFRRYLSL
ncbi:MAG TPA: PIN domain-containing protein, partial [Gaiellaceae bacterium]|nr:PIN domain-containing protein [Gaiellaceae bacterium]